LKLKESVQLWLSSSLNDPIVKIISKSSNLTHTQLETLLIDVLADNFSGKALIYDEKARLRLTKAKISRGAFNRTLGQAKENVTRSIYTVLLLGYLGIFESTSLDPFLEIANKLQAYLDTLKGIPDNRELTDHQSKALEMVRDELHRSLKHLSSPSQDQV